MNEPVVETADGVDLSQRREDPDLARPQRSELPAVEPPRKMPVMGVPTDAETKLVDAEATRFRSRSKYRGWA